MRRVTRRGAAAVGPRCFDLLRVDRRRRTGATVMHCTAVSLPLPMVNARGYAAARLLDLSSKAHRILRKVNTRAEHASRVSPYIITLAFTFLRLRPRVSGLAINLTHRNFSSTLHLGNQRLLLPEHDAGIIITHCSEKKRNPFEYFGRGNK